MTNHDHQHDHHHGHHHEHPQRKRGVHKDWRAWLVVILMLAAMWMYLRTMDESIQPDGQMKPGMPAAPGPPAPAPVGLRPTSLQSDSWIAVVHFNPSASLCAG